MLASEATQEGVNVTYACVRSYLLVGVGGLVWRNNARVRSYLLGTLHLCWNYPGVGEGEIPYQCQELAERYIKAQKSLM